MTSQNPPFVLSCWKPTRLFFWTNAEMSNSSDSSVPPFSDNDDYPLITSFERSHLLLDSGMSHTVSEAFSSSPLSTTMLWEYLFISQNLEQIWLELVWHQTEWEAIFGVFLSQLHLSRSHHSSNDWIPMKTTSNSIWLSGKPPHLPATPVSLILICLMMNQFVQW